MITPLDAPTLIEHWLFCSVPDEPRVMEGPDHALPASLER